MPSAFRAHFRTLCSALVCALSGALPLHAADLYSASAPVTDQSAEQRQEALRAALETVLVRVTGDRAINSWGDSDPILARASELVQRYGYERTEPTEELPAGLLLKASFDGRAVEAPNEADRVEASPTRFDTWQAFGFGAEAELQK